MPTLPSTVERVPRHTAPSVNRRIQARTTARVRAHQRDPRLIPARLAALDREWDVERTLETNAAAVSLTGAALALAVDRRFAVVPLVVGGFLLQHALQGWCPPLPLLRRLGFRTAHEIEEERRQLLAYQPEMALE